jgi:hypothetical protein
MGRSGECTPSEKDRMKGEIVAAYSDIDAAQRRAEPVPQSVVHLLHSLLERMRGKARLSRPADRISEEVRPCL